MSRPFTVWTRWHTALGRSAQARFYAIVVTADGKDLTKELVRNGLARIYGTKATLPSGGTSKAYVAELRTLEREARAARSGGGAR